MEESVPKKPESIHEADFKEGPRSSSTLSFLFEERGIFQVVYQQI